MTRPIYPARRALGFVLALVSLLGPIAGASSAYAQGGDENQETVSETNPYDIDPAAMPPEWGPAGLVGIPHADDEVEPSRMVETPPALWLPNIAGGEQPAQAAEPEAASAVGSGGRVHGDFNNDGYDDLVIGVPSENNAVGLVHILYGGDNGVGAEFLNITAFTAGQRWGAALVAADFNGDNYSDLAASSPDLTVGGKSGAGTVYVYYGGLNGLDIGSYLTLHQDVAGVLDQAEANDEFGESLAAGDFNGDGRDDLVVGVFREDIQLADSTNRIDAGVVHIFFGSASGITTNNNQIWRQNTTNIADDPEASDYFGSALASGDFDNNGRDDLAIGVPDEGIGSVVSAGAVHVLYGTATGLSATNSQFWHQDSAGIADVAELIDFFGRALASGDFDGNGFADLAIGVASDSVGTVQDAGIVHVLYGSASRLTATNSQLWSQNTPSILESSEVDDLFGYTLITGDFNADGYDELAIGAVQESIGTVENGGIVHVLLGSAARLTAANNQVWHQNKSGVEETAETSDSFGLSLGIGDFDGNGADDLSVGVPYEDIEVPTFFSNAGIVQIIYSFPGLGLMLLGDQVWDQSHPGLEETLEVFDLFGISQ